MAPFLRNGDEPSVAELTYRMIDGAPYRYTSDDVIFAVWAARKGMAQKDQATAKAAFFSKGQPCLRASDLTKKYGWGIHFTAQGRVALVGVGTPKYVAFARGVNGLTVKMAMRSARKK